jgi:hypothetical protein
MQSQLAARLCRPVSNQQLQGILLTNIPATWPVPAPLCNVILPERGSATGTEIHYCEEKWHQGANILAPILVSSCWFPDIKNASYP